MKEQPIAADQIADVPHPRETYDLIGQNEAQAEFVAAFKSGKLPHAWLLTGSQGVGKATLAYRIARAMLSEKTKSANFEGDDPLYVNPADSTSHLIENQSHPNLLVLRRSWDEKKKRLMTVLSVDEVRQLHHFYGMSAGFDGWRITIIDTVDDMNVAAANALLKVLEEPPKRSLLILLANQLGKVLPTIRSRCRMLRLAKLKASQVEIILAKQSANGLSRADTDLIVRLSDGSAGYALRLASLNGARIYHQMLQILATCPRIDAQKLATLTKGVTGVQNQEQFQLFFDLLIGFIERVVHLGAQQNGAGGSPVFSQEEVRTATHLLQLPLERLIEVWERLRQIGDDCNELNLDKKQAVFEAFASFERTPFPNAAWQI